MRDAILRFLRFRKIHFFRDNRFTSSFFHLSEFFQTSGAGRGGEEWSEQGALPLGHGVLRSGACGDSVPMSSPRSPNGALPLPSGGVGDVPRPDDHRPDHDALPGHELGEDGSGVNEPRASLRRRLAVHGVAKRSLALRRRRRTRPRLGRHVAILLRPKPLGGAKTRLGRVLREELHCGGAMPARLLHSSPGWHQGPSLRWVL